ncbi:MAG: LytTR family DNA-binding domain-containing protein [Carboxylicivirga sp.]|jgi:two-component system LytT family response regulator|nr:LytTR family DNA-binding domain-containing protein [Carboxylicivirga sp.]
MKTIKTIIVEDDQFDAVAVTRIIEKHFPEIEITNTAAAVEEAVDKIKELRPQLVIMDIHLIGGTAFEVIKACRDIDFKIIFMSAYHEYIIKAMEYAAVDFIFKPFDINEMVVALDKVIDQIQDSNYDIKINTLFNNIESNKNQIILQGKNKFKVCNVDDLVWGKAIPGGANFYLTDNSYFFVAKPLRRYEAILSEHVFFRCHPHYLINLLHVKEINSDLQRIKMNTGDEVIYENRKFDQLWERLQRNATFIESV